MADKTEEFRSASRRFHTFHSSFPFERGRCGPRCIGLPLFRKGQNRARQAFHDFRQSDRVKSELVCIFPRSAFFAITGHSMSADPTALRTAKGTSSQEDEAEQNQSRHTGSDQRGGGICCFIREIPFPGDAKWTTARREPRTMSGSRQTNKWRLRGDLAIVPTLEPTGRGSTPIRSKGWRTVVSERLLRVPRSRWSNPITPRSRERAGPANAGVATRIKQLIFVGDGENSGRRGRGDSSKRSRSTPRAAFFLIPSIRPVSTVPGGKTVI